MNLLHFQRPWDSWNYLDFFLAYFHDEVVCDSFGREFGDILSDFNVMYIFCLPYCRMHALYAVALI